MNQSEYIVAQIRLIFPTIFVEKRRNRDLTIKNKYNTFIDYSHTTDDVYEILEVYNPTKKKKVFIAFDDMIGDMEDNKRISYVVIELSM